MVRSPKSIGGAVRLPLRNAPYKNGDRTAQLFAQVRWNDVLARSNEVASPHWHVFEKDMEATGEATKVKPAILGKNSKRLF